MKVLFSKRHEDALRKKELRPTFPFRVRTAVVRILDRFSVDDSWRNSFDDAGEALKTLLVIQLGPEKSPPDGKEKVNMEVF